jgi:Domain of unknown function (DUF4160)
MMELASSRDPREYTCQQCLVKKTPLLRLPHTFMSRGPGSRVTLNGRKDLAALARICNNARMPTISMFYGIIVRMYFAPREHPPPHFHVYYNQHKATVDIPTCEIMESDLPARQTRLVLAWAELHQEELMANWRLVSNGEEPFKIEPLK